MSRPFKVLISGGGITGPVTAYWLARASTASNPIHVTVIEKASATLESGQGLDVEGAGREVVKRMGLFETIKSRATGEQGCHALDNNSRPYATWRQGFVTQDIEIMRGELCGVLTNAAKERPNVDFQYSRSITNVAQKDDLVRVTLATDDGQVYDDEYSAVIASDGLRSSTRDLILDPVDTKDCIKTRDMFAAYFSVPAQPQDKGYSRLQHGLGGRVVWIRPLSETVSSAYLMAVGAHPAIAESLKQRDQKAKRQAWVKSFSDLEYGEFPRVLEEIQETNNFYSDQISQIKLPTWSKGRCALVGDSAYAPSPITGQGTQLAILGAYILAGELGSNISDPAAAFRAYEKKLRPFVEESQQVPFGGRAPELVCPQTSWGILALQTTLRLSAYIRIWDLIRFLPQQRFSLPDYKFG